MGFSSRPHPRTCGGSSLSMWPCQELVAVGAGRTWALAQWRLSDCDHVPIAKSGVCNGDSWIPTGWGLCPDACAGVALLPPEREACHPPTQAKSVLLIFGGFGCLHKVVFIHVLSTKTWCTMHGLLVVAPLLLATYGPVIMVTGRSQEMHFTLSKSCLQYTLQRHCLHSCAHEYMQCPRTACYTCAPSRHVCAHSYTAQSYTGLYRIVLL